MAAPQPAEQLAALRGRAEEADAFFRAALEEKYAAYPEPFRSGPTWDHHITRWSAVAFVDACAGAGGELRGLAGRLNRLIEIRLEQYYLQEVDVGLYNELYHNPLNTRPDHKPTPMLALRKQAVDQSVIVKSRILWERIMNFVAYFENGEDLEASSRKSKKGQFMALIEDNPRWAWLASYEDVLDSHDEEFRTPEVHQGSVLRKELFEDREVDANRILRLLNEAMNVIWENILAVAAGGTPTHFSGVHLVDGGTGLKPELKALYEPDEADG